MTGDIVDDDPVLDDIVEGSDSVTAVDTPEAATPRKRATNQPKRINEFDLALMHVAVAGKLVATKGAYSADGHHWPSGSPLKLSFYSGNDAVAFGWVTSTGVVDGIESFEVTPAGRKAYATHIKLGHNSLTSKHIDFVLRDVSLDAMPQA